MSRLAQTEGPSDIQTETVKAVRQFVDDKIIPAAQELEHADEYPTDIIEGPKKLGVFGLTIPEKFGGLGESLLTYTPWSRRSRAAGGAFPASSTRTSSSPRCS